MSDKLIIRAKSFRAWFKRHYSKDDCRCICEYGAHMGVHGLIYYYETNAMYDRFEEEIWNIVLAGGGTVANYIDKDHLSDCVQFKNAMVWAAAETLAAEMMH